MKAKLYLLGLFMVWLGVVPNSWAQSSPDAIESLSQFLKFTNSGRAQFSQLVTGPSKAEQAEKRPRVLLNFKGLSNFDLPIKNHLYKPWCPMVSGCGFLTPT